jgi:hydrogenase expression/formation protein HypC
MCLAVPLQVKRIDGVMAEVEMGGVSREISLALTPEAQVGDYVLVHTGFAISVLDEAEALETLALFAELEEQEAADSIKGGAS